MKFECKECLEPCVLDTGNSLYKPETCPLGCEEVKWRPIPEPAALPKLTAEELEKRGIEWPEWAECAVVWPDETCAMYQNQPQLGDGGWLSTGGKWGGAKGLSEIRWDATDWRNSKIMRPAKVKQLPDLIKIGAWAAVGKFVGKVDWMSRDGSECRITLGESRFAKTGEVKAVTFRAWTFEEAPFSIKVRNIKTGKRLAFTLCSQGAEAKPAYWYGYLNVVPLEVFFKEFEQLNGLPCGVQQVEGKDLEG